MRMEVLLFLAGARDALKRIALTWRKGLVHLGRGLSMNDVSENWKMARREDMIDRREDASSPHTPAERSRERERNVSFTAARNSANPNVDPAHRPPPVQTL
jgi:hypothetical protein